MFGLIGLEVLERSRTFLIEENEGEEEVDDWRDVD